MLTATTLVLFMTIPGQAIFFAGMVRTENVLATAMQVFSIACLMTVLWHLVGYSIAFGPADSNEHGGSLIGDLSRVFLQGLGLNTVHQMALTIPENLFCAYQLTFAIATPTLMCGSFAERMRYFPCIIFMGAWMLLVYCPVAHSIWHPDGFLFKMGIMDFAGGLVVHLNAGIGSLMCVVIVGNRKNIDNNFKARSEPHNILFTIIGCCMMWVAWYGFNAGGAYKAGGYASGILLVTQIGASIAGFSWMFVEWAHRGAPSVLGMVNGGVCGLVCITPACGFVDPAAAFFIGLIGGAACLYGTSIKHYFGFDDAIDAFGVNTTGGIVGTFLTGVFATSAVGPTDGLFSAMLKGNFVAGLDVVKVQIYGIIFVTLWSGVWSILILVAIDNIIGLRVSADEERIGLDEALHSETLGHDRRRQSIAEILNYEAMYGSMHGSRHDASIHSTSTHGLLLPSGAFGASRHGVGATSTHGYGSLEPIKESAIEDFWMGVGRGPSKSTHGQRLPEPSSSPPNSGTTFWLGNQANPPPVKVGLERRTSESSEPTSDDGGIMKRVGSEEELRPGEVRFNMDMSHYDMPMVYDDDSD